MASHTYSKAAHSRATAKYRKNHYYTLNVHFPKELEEILKSHAKKNHMALGAYVKQLVLDDIGISENAKPEELTHEPFID